MDGPGRGGRSMGLSSGPAAVRPGMRMPSQSNSSSIMTKAERFEDEKNRIIESCFSRPDENGQPFESYITHIRVVEDAHYPQTPPPPDSPRDNKKERVVILAVRSTGRVRMHKARENNNRSYSIGKTWNFEDLTAVESFANRVTRNDQEAQFRQWAGETGFTVTIAKPYYWQASTAKEKDFFIASLVKVYKKYTQGKVPDLIGFSADEMDQILGLSNPPPTARVGPPSSSMGAIPSQQFGSTRPRGATASSDGRPRFSPAQIDPYSPPPKPLIPGASDQQQQQSSSSSSFDSRVRDPSAGRDRGAGAFQNRSASGGPSPRFPPDSLRAGAGAGASAMRPSDSREQLRPGQTGLTPQSSLSDFGGPRGRDDTTDSVRSAGSNRRGGIYNGSVDPASSQEALISPIPNGLGIERGNGESSSGYRTNGSSEDLNGTARPPLSERRRPPLGTIMSNGTSKLGSDDPSVKVPFALRVGQRDGAASGSEATANGDVSDQGNNRPSRSVSPVQMDSELSPLPLRPSSKGEVKPPGAPVPEPFNIAPSEQPQSPDSTGTADKDASDENRPGLGRMFGNNKKSARELFKTAATAYNAFKPRAGGAAARIRASDSKTTEPDGISGVVPAPSLFRSPTSESFKTSDSSIQGTPTSVVAQDKIPDLKVTSPTTPAEERKAPFAPVASKLASETSKSSRKPKPTTKAQPKSKVAEEETARRKLRRTPQQIKNLERLGLDPSLIEDRGLEFEAVLEEFWPENQRLNKPVELLEADIRREVARVGAGSWIRQLERGDSRVDEVARLLDQTISECDDLDRLLTLYNVELNSLADDIAYIEAQGQGLQVQTANQKLLMVELQTLLSTITITPRQLDPLFSGMISSLDGLESTERALLALYKALIMIDPTMRQSNNSGSSQDAVNAEYSTMRAVQEKRDEYLEASSTFLTRFKNHMEVVYGQVMLSTLDIVKKTPTRPKSVSKLSVDSHDLGRKDIWQYNAIMLYARDVDKKAWQVMMRSYQAKVQQLYAEEFREAIQSWKKVGRAASGDETELLFTFSESQADGLSGASRKRTVKRSQTLARSFRSGSGEKGPRNSGMQNSSLYAFEVFSAALDDMSPLVFAEQNFIIDFFHASGSEKMDFADLVQSILPENRRGSDPLLRKPFEADRDMARIVAAVMEELFSFWPSEMQALIDWSLGIDPLQAVGIMYALNRTIATLDETNQDFLIRTLTTLSTRLSGLWARFLDEQIRAIEETKVKIKKRKGVIAFIKTFSNFSAAVENMLPSAADEPPEINDVRVIVDKAYERINKAMFESLRVIAKESPATAPHGGASDPEDKEALNYHILLIENMNHYVEEVDERGDSVLAEGRHKAKEEFEEHLSLYVDAVIRRPLGKIMDFTESIQHALESLGDNAPSSLATRPSFSHNTFRKLVAAHDARELRRGVEALRKRVDKHFGDADELELSRNLVIKVLSACEERFSAEIDRLQTLPKQVYAGEESVQIAVGRDDMTRWFKGAR